ncbi:hypothetical protein A2914_00895 [Candidatus Nomurabacteria bacterium RIFCSPLOWO2_01_FULL_41_21]|uniref:Uncharacterized protein n=2 Tax=Candidatus Nomuraibacteriota TaxID=1752729 RepID=A0A1F6V275_9BACT|nr:MAG: hypothetical protein A2733_01985 [Candidatus Nomurabacteria bacterium RIFCSPHIGHO2_01_FULL_40_20]OGI87873.1 MAG: hypothetical protein A2914_00895 [Candidatus Nomurabacteria bacterium RIFCSPLOWO2_01_FULL_41_21]
MILQSFFLTVTGWDYFFLYLAFVIGTIIAFLFATYFAIRFPNFGKPEKVIKNIEDIPFEGKTRSTRIRTYAYDGIDQEIFPKEKEMYSLRPREISYNLRKTLQRE